LSRASRRNTASHEPGTLLRAGHEEETLVYYASIGPTRGPALYRDTPPTTGVLESPGIESPVGTATEAGWTENGVALWRLIVNGTALPGRWAIEGRQFIPQFKSATDPDRL
jgi:hypothetical protein